MLLLGPGLHTFASVVFLSVSFRSALCVLCFFKRSWCDLSLYMLSRAGRLLAFALVFPPHRIVCMRLSVEASPHAYMSEYVQTYMYRQPRKRIYIANHFLSLHERVLAAATVLPLDFILLFFSFGSSFSIERLLLYSCRSSLSAFFFLSCDLSVGLRSSCFQVLWSALACFCASPHISLLLLFLDARESTQRRRP